MSESEATQSTDRSTESGRRIARTYGRTHEDELVQMSDLGCESNARGSEKPGSIEGVGALGPIVWGRSLRFAEQNGAKVIVDVDLPESVLQALAALVDAVQREFGTEETRRRLAEVDLPKPMCRWHPGQLADYCGPCRSERISAS